MKVILYKPLVTEKSTILQEQNQYAFEVAREANKIEIAKAVEKKFKVRVLDVKTSIKKGKQKTQFTRRGRFTGYTADRKKAIVRLHKDDKIDFLGAEQS
ncbi:MAG: 50S ribosomal protein L23 [Ignavibacteria bacterium]|nr:50S ribosomal protein L23 [Ignavibacteria bacterium]